MAFTKVLGPGIHTLSNITSHNIHSSGIITAISFIGDGSGLTGVASTDNIVTGSAATFTGGVNINSDLDVDGHTNLDNVSIAGVTTFAGGLTGTTANFSGDVNIAGVLTYEDVKNVDSVGLITARNGINVSGGNVTIANILAVSGVSTFSQDVKFEGTTSGKNLNWDYSANKLVLNDNTTLQFGSTNGDSQFFHSGGDLHLFNNVGNTFVKSSSVYNIQAGHIRFRNHANNEDMANFYQNGHVAFYFDSEEKFRTTDTGIRIGTGVTIETNGQATYTGIITATAFKLADGSAIGAGAGGTWSTYTAGIATSKSVGVNTSNLDDNDLVGVGNSFQGLYISNGMLIHDNSLNGNHYIGTSMSGLMAGPVNIEGTLTIDGNYVVV